MLVILLSKLLPEVKNTFKGDRLQIIIRIVPATTIIVAGNMQMS